MTLARDVAVGDNISFTGTKFSGGEVVAVSRKEGKVTIWLKRVGHKIPVLRDVQEDAEVSVD